MDEHGAIELAAATNSLRELILAAEHFGLAAANALALRVSDSQAVSYLYARGAMGQTALGELLGLNTGTMTVLVDRLERSGIAKRIPHPTDRRRLIVQLTEPGRASLDRTSSWLSTAFEGIPPSQLGAVSTALMSIAADLRDRAVPMSISAT